MPLPKTPKKGDSQTLSKDWSIYYQREERQEEFAVFADDVKCSTTQVDEMLEFLTRLVSAVDDVYHVGSENKWSTVPG